MDNSSNRDLPPVSQLPHDAVHHMTVCRDALLLLPAPVADTDSDTGTKSRDVSSAKSKKRPRAATPTAATAVAAVSTTAVRATPVTMNVDIVAEPDGKSLKKKKRTKE